MQKQLQPSVAPASPRVLAIGLDAPNHDLLVQWIGQGHLANLQALQQRSSQLIIESRKRYSNEHCWIPMLTGQSRDRWNHWLDHWNTETYAFSEASIFDWIKAPLFYALGDQCRVISFDLTAPVVANVSGIQVSGWATELNECYPLSSPPEVLDTLLSRYGPDPKLTDSHAITNRLSNHRGITFAIPSLYQQDQIEHLVESQIRSIERRTQACLDLMAEEPWDLFLTLYSEIHTAGHILWHLSQPHPLDTLRPDDADPMLRVYQAMDRSVGELLAAVDDSVTVVFYTVDAMVPDCLENARAVFLPEFLYRWNFPGKAALAEGDPSVAPPSPSHDYRQHWKHEVWRLRTRTGDRELQSPAELEAREDPMSWCPASWYGPLWPRMKAFAMPSVADGYIRLNVVGRESAGIVEDADFVAVCSDLAAEISRLVNPRTGKGVVREIIRVRDSAFDLDPKDPPADLIVVFREDCPLDVVDSPLAGRIGPVPYFRTGSHQAHGGVLQNLMYIRSVDIMPGHQSGVARLEDIPATLLALLGQVPAADFDGVARL